MTRRVRSVGIVLLIVAAVSVGLVAAILAVRTHRWPEDTIFVPRDVDTVQQAVERASPGATVVLQRRRDGEPFRGPITIDVAGLRVCPEKGRALIETQGMDPGITVRADGVILQTLDVVSEGVGVCVESSRCEIEDVRVLAAPIGIQLLNAQACAVESVELDVEQIGFELVNAGGNTLVDVVVRGASESGVRGVGSWGNTLEGVDVFDAPIGISFGEGSFENELRACWISRATVAGVQFRASNDNLLSDSRIDDSWIGVVFQSATGNEIRRSKIDRADTVGISLKQAIQNRVTANSIDGSHGVGILLEQSAENTLSYNGIEGCDDAGIRLITSDNNLVLGNILRASHVGIDVDRCHGDRMIRNDVKSGVDTGIHLRGGSEHQLFDNRLFGGVVGVMSDGSTGSTMLRNRIEDQETTATCLIGGSHATRVAQNRLVGCQVGTLVVASERCEILGNKLSENDTGLLLIHAGPGTRIEGNTIERNRIGLRQTDNVDVAVEVETVAAGRDEGSPIIVHNLFARNRSMDISNETASELHAGGNWWGSVTEAQDTTVAKISGDVDLEGSAWRGTVAVGAEANLTQEILGRVVEHVFSEEGFRVIDLVGIGDAQRVREAFKAGDVDLVLWEGTSEAMASEMALSGGEIEFVSIPATRRWVGVVSQDTAAHLAEPTISAFSAWLIESNTSCRYAVSKDLDAGTVSAFEQVYGLADSVESINWAESLEEAEVLLKLGAVKMAIVDSLEETLTRAGFIALRDDLGVLGVEVMAVALHAGLRTQFPDSVSRLEHLAESMTSSTLHDLNSRVRLLQHHPDAVVREHLGDQAWQTE